MSENKAPTVETVVNLFHEFFPPQIAEGWDSCGLVCGRPEQSVKKIGFAVDATVATAQEATEHQAQLLITHHPLLLKGASFLPASDYKGQVLHTLIESGCALLGAHTNVDSAPLGTNDSFMHHLEISDFQILADQQQQLIRGKETTVGIGAVGDLSAPITLKELAFRIAEFLPATAAGLRVAGPHDAPVQKIALCTGAGDSLFDEVRASGADVYITADLRHHPASEARETARVSGEGKPYLIDCSHFASEWLWLHGAAESLKAELARRGFEVQTYVSELNTDPWDFTVSTGQTAGSSSTLR